MALTEQQYKERSICEFTRAAAKYETKNAGIYNLCKKDYPAILQELEKEPFTNLLDAGCGTAPMLSLLTEKYPERYYTGIDLTPAMILLAERKRLPNTTFVVGDCENLPFADNSFDVVICSMSFHHYPNPQKFFDSVKRCLKPNGRLILRDMTTDNKAIQWFCNHIEMPLINFFGFGDVAIATRETVYRCAEQSGLTVERFEIQKGMRLHCIVRKENFV